MDLQALYRTKPRGGCQALTWMEALFLPRLQVAPRLLSPTPFSLLRRMLSHTHTFLLLHQIANAGYSHAMHKDYLAKAEMRLCTGVLFVFLVPTKCGVM